MDLVAPPLPALLAAAQGGDAAGVAAALAERPDAASQRDSDGRTALHWAAVGGHQAVVEALFDSEQEILLDNQDDGGWTALMSAASAGREAIVRLLLGRGANANLRTRSREQALHFHKGRPRIAELLLLETADVDAQCASGTTALSRAMARQSEPVMRLLLAADASANTVDACGNTPVHIAALERNLALARMLAENSDFSMWAHRNSDGQSAQELVPMRRR